MENRYPLPLPLPPPLHHEADGSRRLMIVAGEELGCPRRCIVQAINAAAPNTQINSWGYGPLLRKPG